MHNSPQLLTILTVILWSAGVLVGKLLSDGPVFFFVVISQFSAAAFLIIAKVFSGKPLALKKILTPAVVVTGFIGHAGYWIFFLHCLRSSPNASVPGILNYTWPVFTVIFSEYIFNYKKTALSNRFFQFSGIALGLAGVVIVSTKGDLTSLHNINLITASLGIAAGMSYGFFSAYSSKISLTEQTDFLIIAASSSAFFLLPFVYQELPLISSLTFYDYLLAMWLGVIVDGAGSVIWIRANRIAAEQKINISKAASLIYLLPVFSLILVTVYLKETIYAETYFIVSLFLILGSVIICNKSK